MRETQHTTKELIADILSGDAHKVWSSICIIASLSQNHQRVMEISRYKYIIKFATRRILRGWPYSPDCIRLRKIFRMIDFHRQSNDCPCCLLGQEDNPHNVVEEGYFDLLQTVPYEPKCTINDYYILRYSRCGIIYKVFEREYHSAWWDWHRLEDENGSTEKRI